MLMQSEGACWRIARAGRASLLIDMEAYFDAAKAAMERANRSIHFLNWAFEPDTLFHPKPAGGGDDGDRIANFLKALVKSRPHLDIRVLCWKSAMPVAATQHFFPLADRGAFAGAKVRFVLDGKLPRGACHHQKMIVIDDAVAFCGGGDIGPDRWDTPQHLDDDPRREKTRRDNRCFDSRHEVMAAVDGPAAAALGELFRARWLRCTGETLPSPDPGAPTAWPPILKPDFRDIATGLSRTSARWRAHGEAREAEALHLASIAAARRCIYMENQYFSSEVIAHALAERLKEARGPEVVLISAEHSPSYFDQMTMDRTRSIFIKTLQQADRHGRLAIYSPVTALGRTIIVHAKLAIVDDRLLRVGSANINNRSGGFDTECDLSLEAEGPASAPARRTIDAIRTRLLAHWLGCSTSAMATTIRREGGVIAAIEALRTSGHCRLRPIPAVPLGPLATLIANFHLGDPVGPDDSWRPWKRRRALQSRMRAASAAARASVSR